MNKDKVIAKSPVKWIDLEAPEPSEPYYETKDYSVHCNWNYTKLMDHLPCGRITDWNERQAKELIEPIKLSLAKLESYPMMYQKYLSYPDGHFWAVDGCHEILQTCLENFEEAPDLLITIY